MGACVSKANNNSNGTGRTPGSNISGDTPQNAVSDQRIVDLEKKMLQAEMGQTKPPKTGSLSQNHKRQANEQADTSSNHSL